MLTFHGLLLKGNFLPSIICGTDILVLNWRYILICAKVVGRPWIIYFFIIATKMWHFGTFDVQWVMEQSVPTILAS